jgi:phosphoenolpyruvate phosphomutase
VKRTTRFRELLISKELTFICETHNGLSGKIVEEAGFAAIWVSGLKISSQLGVRDNNEASWTHVLDVLEFMAEATSVPILVEGDTGYADFNNVQRLVRKLEQRSIAAVCLEDKESSNALAVLKSAEEKISSYAPSYQESDQPCRSSAGQPAHSNPKSRKNFPTEVAPDRSIETQNTRSAWSP